MYSHSEVHPLKLRMRIEHNRSLFDLRGLDELRRFSAVVQGKQLLWLPRCISGNQASSLKMGLL